ncbi:MAG TPA: transcriptional regulator NrdR [Actinomycetota bacterium]|jgi:transcriptional repressor NrdR
MRCPYCRSVEDRVIDSRLAEEGASIRRRRECGNCGRRYTTFERIESVPLVVVKRSGERAPFNRQKLIAGLAKACVNRPVSAETVERVADEIEQAIRGSGGSVVSTQEIGLAILDRLRDLDEVAYLRFASVYKDFQELSDFEREVGQLLQKKTPPKPGEPAEGGEARELSANGV